MNVHGHSDDPIEILDQLRASAGEQARALDRAIAERNWPQAVALGACLRTTIERLEKATIALVVVDGQNRASQRDATELLDALHDHVQPLLLRIRGEHPPVEIRRSATRATLDPLAAYRSAIGIIDLSERVLENVSLRDADLAMARLTLARLRDIDAQGARFDGAIGIEAGLDRINLAEGTLRDANLQATNARDCDFSRADLTGARWVGGTAIRCSFVGATLTDLCADGAFFLSCDLRGADLAVRERGDRATLRGTRFFNCDLRWSRWDRRILDGAQFVRCRFYGIGGRPRADGVIVDEPDLAEAGEPTVVASLGDVLALWSGVRRPGVDRSPS